MTAVSNRFKEIETADVWAKQLAFMQDHLDIAIEMMFPPIKLKDQQKVIARAFGRSNT